MVEPVAKVRSPLPPSGLPSFGTPESPVKTVAPAEPPSSPLPGSLPTETVTPAPGSSSPMPFFSSEESGVVPKVTALQPYQGPEDAQRAAPASTVLPAANRLIPRLQPGGRTAAVPRAGGLPSSGPCTTCKTAVSGTKTKAALQGGESFIQNEISTTYTGVCEGQYVYEYANLTSNKTIGMKVITSGGEAWTFTLKPGQKTSIKSSTEFISGTYENIRLSEVMN